MEIPSHLTLDVLQLYVRRMKGIHIFRLFNRSLASKQTLLALQSKRFMSGLTSKRSAEVWRTGYECSLYPGNENLKLEMETPKFPSKIDLNFHWQSSSLQTETSDFEPDFLFSFLNSTQPAGWIL